MTVVGKYRTFWRRFFAGYVDAALFLPLTWLDDWIWYREQTPAAWPVWFVFHTLSFRVYSILTHGLFGQTLGKRLLGIRVVDVSGRALTMMQAIRRDALYFPFDVWTLYSGLMVLAFGASPYEFGYPAYRSVQWVGGALFALELLTTLTNPKRRALHDFIAGSVVIRTHVEEPRDSEESEVDEGPIGPIGPGQFACLECRAPVNLGSSQCSKCDQPFDYRDGEPIRRQTGQSLDGTLD